MPIYEFLCKPCGEQFELLTTISGASDARCPKCNSRRVKRLMSAFAVRTGGSTSSGSGNGCAHYSSGNCSTCR